MCGCFLLIFSGPGKRSCDASYCAQQQRSHIVTPGRAEPELGNGLDCRDHGCVLVQAQELIQQCSLEQTPPPASEQHRRVGSMTVLSTFQCLAKYPQPMSQRVAAWGKPGCHRPVPVLTAHTRSPCAHPAGLPMGPAVQVVMDILGLGTKHHQWCLLPMASALCTPENYILDSPESMPNLHLLSWPLPLCNSLPPLSSVCVPLKYFSFKLNLSSGAHSTMLQSQICNHSSQTMVFHSYLLREQAKP